MDLLEDSANLGYPVTVYVLGERRQGVAAVLDVLCLRGKRSQGYDIRMTMTGTVRSYSCCRGRYRLQSWNERRMIAEERVEEEQCDGERSDDLRHIADPA